MSALIRKISGNEDVGDHIKVTCESLKSIHKGKSKDQRFLSGAHLQLFYEHLNQPPRFTHSLPRYNGHYEAVKELVTKAAGDDDQATVSSFLRTQFPFLRVQKIS